MRLFELVPDDTYDTYIEAGHRWNLPGVKCATCGATWGNVGVAYPAVDLSVLSNANEYREPWPVAWPEFEKLRSAVVPLLPSGAPAPPGTGLGPLVGRARGTFPSLTWQNSWTVLVHTTVLTALRGRGVGLCGGVAQLKHRGEMPELTELQLMSIGQLAPSCLPPEGFARCSSCGREAVTRPERVIVDGASVSEAPPIFRLSDLTTMILATEAAVDAIVDLKLEGARFEEIQLV